MAFVSFRKVRGLIVFLLKLQKARLSLGLQKGAESQPGVISVVACDIERVDHSHGESGVSTNQPTGSKSLWLKILPLSY
jgi:hypothetical protein